MSEKIFNTPEMVDATYVYETRTRMNKLLNDFEAFDALQDQIVTFDAELKKYVKDHFGSTAWLQQVDMWQALIGGSIEEREDITEDFYADVSGKVANFVVQLNEVLNGSREVSEISYDFSKHS